MSKKASGNSEKAKAAIEELLRPGAEFDDEGDFRIDEIRESAFKPQNRNTINLADAIRRHHTAVHAANRPIREKIISKLVAAKHE